MMYSFMRVILFFDLPMITKKDVRVYNHFRKVLIKNGYMMLQFSVYSKICNNRDAAEKHITMIKKNVPQEGQIRIMMFTEKQYSNINIIIGGKSNQESILTINPFILL